MSGLLAFLWTEQGLVVGNQHLDRDSRHVQSVQEILESLVEFVLGVDMEIAIIPHVVKSFCHSWNSILNIITSSDIGRYKTKQHTWCL